MATAPSEGVRCDLVDGIQTITLARPERLNSLTLDSYGALRNAFVEAERDARVRVVVLRGEGRAFSSGADIHELVGRLLSLSATEVTAFARLTGDLAKTMRRLRKPIIAEVGGIAAGAGAVLALAADFRIATADARFAFLYTKAGLCAADMGAAYLLPRVVGLARATELLMLGDTISADDALRYGLVNDVVPSGDLHAKVRALATRLSHGPTFALGMTKELINRGLGMDIDGAIDAESNAQAICLLSEDFEEFHSAWIAKRPPQFRGR